MKTILHGSLDLAVRSAIRQRRQALGPQLCCEVADVDGTSAMRTILAALKTWERELMFCIAREGGSWRTRVISHDDLPTLVIRALEDEEVLTVVDAVNMGGCAFDFTPKSLGVYDLLITGWDPREDTILWVDRELGGGGVWRGN